MDLWGEEEVWGDCARKDWFQHWCLWGVVVGTCGRQSGSAVRTQQNDLTNGTERNAARAQYPGTRYCKALENTGTVGHAHLTRARYSIPIQ